MQKIIWVFNNNYYLLSVVSFNSKKLNIGKVDWLYNNSKNGGIFELENSDAPVLKKQKLLDK